MFESKIVYHSPVLKDPFNPHLPLYNFPYDKEKCQKKGLLEGRMAVLYNFDTNLMQS